jgi:hypothetical protein
MILGAVTGGIGTAARVGRLVKGFTMAAAGLGEAMVGSDAETPRALANDMAVGAGFGLMGHAVGDAFQSSAARQPVASWIRRQFGRGAPGNSVTSRAEMGSRLQRVDEGAILRGMVWGGTPAAGLSVTRNLSSLDPDDH